MIRIDFRTIHIPRGDTGSFSIENIPPYEEDGSFAILYVYDILTRKPVLEKIVCAGGEFLTFCLSPEDTVNLEEKTYIWDVKLYRKPIYDEETEELLGAREIDSFYAGVGLPKFIVEKVASTGLRGEENE